MYKIELTVETEQQKNEILELLRESEEDGILDFSFNTLVSNADQDNDWYSAQDALMEHDGGRSE